MDKNLRACILTIIFISIPLVSGGIQTEQVSNVVSFPEGYRNWTGVKSEIVPPGHAIAPAIEAPNIFTRMKQRSKGMKRVNGPTPPSWYSIHFLILGARTRSSKLKENKLMSWCDRLISFLKQAVGGIKNFSDLKGLKDA